MYHAQCPNCSGFQTYTKLESWLISACKCLFVLGCFGGILFPLAFPAGFAAVVLSVTVGRLVCRAFVRAVRGTWVCDLCNYKWAGRLRPVVPAHAAAMAYRAAVIGLLPGDLQGQGLRRAD